MSQRAIARKQNLNRLKKKKKKKLQRIAVSHFILYITIKAGRVRGLYKIYWW